MGCSVPKHDDTSDAVKLLEYRPTRLFIQLNMGRRLRTGVKAIVVLLLSVELQMLGRLPHLYSLQLLMRCTYSSLTKSCNH